MLSVNQDPGIGPKRAKGAAVHLMAMRKAFESLGMECIGVDEAHDPRFIDALSGIVSQRPVDLIYERYALGKSNAAQFAIDNDIPLVLEVNAPLADEQRRWRGASNEDEDARCDAFAMRSASKIIAVSSDVARYAIERGARASQVEVFPNGIDTDYFNISMRQKSVRNELIPEGRFVIGFHGRLRPWHGFDVLVDVMARLLGKNMDIHMLVIGEGDFDELGHLPRDRYTRITWQPHSEIPRYVAAFDVLPLTYKADMPCYFSPLKLMEAMACGVVPLVPGLGDLAATVTHEDTGLVYEAGDISALQNQLETLINDKTMLASLGCSAAKEASCHSWVRIADYVLDTATRRGRQEQGAL